MNDADADANDADRISAARLTLPTAALAAGVLAWWAVVALLGVPPYLLPAPDAVATNTINNVNVVEGLASATAAGTGQAIADNNINNVNVIESVAQATARGTGDAVATNRVTSTNVIKSAATAAAGTAATGGTEADAQNAAEDSITGEEDEDEDEN